MTEQDAKEYIKLYNDATGSNYSISNDSGFDSQQVNDSETTKISKAEFNELTAKDQRDFIKEHPDQFEPAQTKVPTKEEKLERYYANEQKRQEDSAKKVEARKREKEKQQEVQHRRENPERTQYSSGMGSQESGIDSRQLQTIITLLEKIVQNTSIGIS